MKQGFKITSKSRIKKKTFHTWISTNRPIFSACLRFFNLLNYNSLLPHPNTMPFHNTTLRIFLAAFFVGGLQLRWTTEQKITAKNI